MRVLLFTRGAPGSGKSTWIREHGLLKYTVCPDDLRQLYRNDTLDIYGNEKIPQDVNSKVWKTVMEILEVRMSNGDFTVFDATNTKRDDINKLKKLCQKYRYRMCCVDFTGVPIEIAKERNNHRSINKQVHDEVIEKMYDRIQNETIPSGIRVLDPNTAYDEILYTSTDLSDYNAINHIGDIHGCNTVLQEALSEIDDDEFYIFCGDYIDRGIENVETLKTLLSLSERENVIFIEGNHERWLWEWANNRDVPSPEFTHKTMPQLESSGVSKKEIRKFCRNLRQCIEYVYNGKTVFVCHGGISGYGADNNPVFVSTNSMVKGVGSYADYYTVAESFEKNTNGKNIFQVFGHRNIHHSPAKICERSFLLEDGVESGGNLRVLRLTKDAGFELYEYKNSVFRCSEYSENVEMMENNINDFVNILRDNPNIREKKFGNISSFNFTKNAFKKGIWDNQTIKARGLYIDTARGKIFARGYDKFFNIGERNETKIEHILKTVHFPVKVYKKYNGFLGLLAFDSYKDELFYATKSEIDGEHTRILKDVVRANLDNNTINEIKNDLRNMDATLLVECIDTKNDPHIIECSERKIVGLDIVSNTIKFENVPYDDFKLLTNKYGIECKLLIEIVNTKERLLEIYEECNKESDIFTEDSFEGYVLIDADGNMYKMKTYYYKFWKYMRSIVGAIRSYGNCILKDERKEVLEFVKWLQNNEDTDIINYPIHVIRDKYSLEVNSSRK